MTDDGGLYRQFLNQVYNTAGIGNLEVPIYFLKSKLGYTVRKAKKMYIVYVDK
jgi:hypothetical protein